MQDREVEWVYDESKFAIKPSDAAFASGLQHEALQYKGIIQSLSQLKSCIASGFPFIFGITIFSSFESDEVAKTGKVPLPSHADSMCGGHCIAAVGYSDTTQKFICRNSWSSSWGDKGYFYLDYSYVTNPGLASDFWTISLVS